MMISITNLGKKYDQFELNISLEIPDGTITGIIGKNGAGKSTTIKSILGLIKPDSGSVIVLGKQADQLSVSDKQKIGVTMAESSFSNYLRVEDIIQILKKMYREFDETKFRNVCQKHKLPLNKQLKDFSTGMKAKIKVLVAITHNADLLVLDEPTAGLDIESRMEILDMLRAYIAENENRSILISSHISSDLEGLCDDLYLIHNGEVLLHEDTDTVLDQYAIIKPDQTTYESMDKTYIIKSQKERFGYRCFTNQKQFYTENYPGMVIENSNIDDLIIMMTGEQ